MIDQLGLPTLEMKLWSKIFQQTLRIFQLIIRFILCSTFCSSWIWFLMEIRISVCFKLLSCGILLSCQWMRWSFACVLGVFLPAPKVHIYIYIICNIYAFMLICSKPVLFVCWRKKKISFDEFNIIMLDYRWKFQLEQQGSSIQSAYMLLILFAPLYSDFQFLGHTCIQPHLRSYSGQLRRFRRSTDPHQLFFLSSNTSESRFRCCCRNHCSICSSFFVFKNSDSAYFL